MLFGTYASSQTTTDLQLSCSFDQECMPPSPSAHSTRQSMGFSSKSRIAEIRSIIKITETCGCHRCHKNFTDRVDQSRSLLVQNKHETPTQKYLSPRWVKELKAKTRTYLPWKTYGCVPCASAVLTRSRTLQLSTRCWRGRPHLSVKVSQGVAETSCQARVSAASLLERVPSSGSQSEACVFLYG